MLFLFDTYNSSGQLGFNNSLISVNNHIHPMQAFWESATATDASLIPCAFRNISDCYNIYHPSDRSERSDGQGSAISVLLKSIEVHFNYKKKRCT